MDKIIIKRVWVGQCGYTHINIIIWISIWLNNFWSLYYFALVTSYFFANWAEILKGVKRLLSIDCHADEKSKLLWLFVDYEVLWPCWRKNGCAAIVHSAMWAYKNLGSQTTGCTWANSKSNFWIFLYLNSPP